MKRYITMYHSNPLIMECYAEDENWQERQALAEEWVWQFAESKRHALVNHTKAHDAWCEEVNTAHDEMETELTEFSPAADVLECVLNAYRQLTSNENVYDDGNDVYMSIDAVVKVITQLRESQS